MTPNRVDERWWEENKSSFVLSKKESEEIKDKIASESCNYNWEEIANTFIDLLKTVPSLKKYESLKYLNYKVTSFSSYILRLNPYVLGLIDENKIIHFISNGERYFSEDNYNDYNVNILDPNFKNKKVELIFSINCNCDDYAILRKYPLIFDYSEEYKFRELLTEGDPVILERLQQLFLKETHDLIIKENRKEEFKRYLLQDNNVVNIIRKFPEYEEIILDNQLFNYKVLNKYNNSSKPKKQIIREDEIFDDLKTLEDLKSVFEF